MSNIQYTNEITLKNFKQLDVEIIPNQKSVWLYFNSQPRPCYTLTLLKELDTFQSILRQHKGKLPCDGKLVDIEFNVISSRHAVFSFGGDIAYFIKCIENKDREALRSYAKYSIDAVYFNHIGREFNITTISLIHGNALGGGFEAALSSHVLIAERNTEMGLPEILFNLFPGMGAYNLLAQKLSPSLVEKIILNGRLYSSEELYDMGIIDILAEDNEGKATVDSYIHSIRSKRNSISSVIKMRNLIKPIDYQQLIDIGDLWVEAALNLSEKDERIMKRLVRSQDRFSAEINSAPMTHVTAS